MTPAVSVACCAPRSIPMRAPARFSVSIRPLSRAPAGAMSRMRDRHPCPYRGDGSPRRYQQALCPERRAGDRECQPSRVGSTARWNLRLVRLWRCRRSGAWALRDARTRPKTEGLADRSLEWLQRVEPGSSIPVVGRSAFGAKRKHVTVPSTSAYRPTTVIRTLAFRRQGLPLLRHSPSPRRSIRSRLALDGRDETIRS